MASPKRIIGFLASATFQRAVGFLMMTYLTLHLGAEEFSRYSLFLSLLVLFSGAGGLALQFAPLRLSFDCRSDTERASLLKTVLIGSVVACLSLYLFLLALSHLTSWIPVNVLSPTELAMSGMIICGTVVYELALTVFRYEGHIRRYAGLIAINVVLTTIFVIGFEALRGPALTSILIGYLAALILTLAQSTYELSSRLKNGLFSKKVLTTALHYSGPIAAHSLCIWVIQHAGRWIGTAFISLDEIAPYLVLVQIVSVVGMLGRSIFDSAVPQIGHFIQEETWSKIETLTWKLAAIAGTLVLIAYLGAAALLYATPIKWPTYVVIAPKLLGLALIISLVDIMYVRGIQILQATKRTSAQARLSAAAAIVVSVANLFLARQYGAIGLVWGMLFGTLFLAISFNFSGLKTMNQLRHNANA